MSVVSYQRAVMLPEWDRLDEIEYCIGCRDDGSGVYGTFAYDSSLCAGGLGMFAISPVFSNVEEFLGWAKLKGFRYFSNREFNVLTKTFPV